MEYLNLENIISHKNFIIIFSVGIFFLVVINYLKRSFIIFSIFILPGTTIHELSHLITSFIFYGKPKKFSIIPKRTETGYILGYVASANIKWYNGWIISLSPLLLIPLIYILLLIILKENNLYIIIVESYLLSSFLYASIPSRQDIKVAIKSSWILLSMLLLITITYYVLFQR